MSAIGLALLIIAMPGIASAKALSIMGGIMFFIGQAWLSLIFSRNIVAPSNKGLSTALWGATTLLWFVFYIMNISNENGGGSADSFKTMRIIFTLYSFSYLIQNFVQLVCSKAGRWFYLLAPGLMSVVFCTISIMWFQDVPAFLKDKTLAIIIFICVFLSLFLKMAVQYLGASKRDTDSDLYLTSAQAKQHSLFGVAGLGLIGLGALLGILFKVVKPGFGLMPNSTLSTVFIVLEILFMLLIATLVVRINSMTKKSPIAYAMTALGFVLFILLIGVSEGHIVDNSSSLLIGLIVTNVFFGAAAAKVYDSDEKSTGVARYIAFGSLVGLAVPFLMAGGILVRLGISEGDLSWDMTLTSLCIMHVVVVLAYLPAMIKAMNAHIQSLTLGLVFSFLFALSMALCFVIKPSKKYLGYDRYDRYEYRSNHNYDYDDDDYDYDYDW